MSNEDRVAALEARIDQLESRTWPISRSPIPRILTVFGYLVILYVSWATVLGK